MIVDIFIPCFIDQLYPETAFNMVKVLEGVGCRVNYNTEQTCCGQPAFNSGHWDDAKELGEKFLKEFSGDRYIVVPSGSCCGFMRNYYSELFQNTVLHNKLKSVRSRLFEFTEFLVDVLKIDNLNAKLDAKAVYHDGCGSLRECNINEAPRKLLKNVKGLELVDINEPNDCCGFGGAFSVKYEAISVAMGTDKVENIMYSGADHLISGDMSCLLHLDGILAKKGSKIRSLHIADVLAAGW